MNNVIGPISQEDWNVMATIAGTLPEMKKDPVRFATAITMEEEILKNYKKKYLL